MQFYHHPLSLHSQKARIALEEKEIDYWAISVNPLKGRNLDAEFFGQNPNAQLPMLTNGNRVLIGSLPIVQYVDNFFQKLGGDQVDPTLAMEWMQKIDSWNPQLFTLSNISEKHREFYCRFKRQVIIARLAENPRFAKNQLVSTQYLAGNAFSMADAMFLPILGRIELLKLDNELIESRIRVAEYYNKVKKRPSYKIVIGQYSTTFGKLRVLGCSVLNMKLRTLFKRY